MYLDLRTLELVTWTFLTVIVTYLKKSLTIRIYFKYKYSMGSIRHSNNRESPVTLQKSLFARWLFEVTDIRSTVYSFSDMFFHLIFFSKRNNVIHSAEKNCLFKFQDCQDIMKISITHETIPLLLSGSRPSSTWGRASMQLSIAIMMEA